MISLHSALAIIEQLFPFGFCVNDQGEFTVLFKSFKKYFPNAQLGEKFYQYLEPTEQNQASFPSAIERKIAIFKDKQSNVKFRGQFVLLNQDYVFTAGLQTQSMKELIAKKLNFSDFSMQDPLFDFIMLISTERASNVELNGTLKKLEFKLKLDTHLQEIAIQLSFCTNLENALGIVSSQLGVIFEGAKCIFHQNLLALPQDIREKISSGNSHWNHGEGESCYYFSVRYSEEIVKCIEFKIAEIKYEDNSVKSFLVVLGQLILGVIERDLRQEQARDHYAKMAHSEKLVTLGEISAGIAHEINNPLAVIKTSAKSILRNAQALDEKTQDNLETVVSMVDRISKIVKGLRSYARDGAKDPFESTNIETIFTDSIALCQAKIDLKSIKLTVNLPKQNLIAKCRSVQVSQVLVNLINNSIDAVEPLDDKWIKVEAFVIANNFLRVQVTDSGSGIPPEIVQKIMTPFFTTKAPGKGTGLGMSISIGIISEHGGVFKVDSSSPNTCIYFTLPMAAAKAA